MFQDSLDFSLNNGINCNGGNRLSLVKKSFVLLFLFMAQSSDMDEAAILRAVLYFSAAILLIIVFSLVGLMLSAELKKQPRLQARYVNTELAQHQQPAPSWKRFW